MTRNRLLFAVLVLFLLAYAVAFPHVRQVRKPLRTVQARGIILPPAVVKLISLEFRTLVADFLFARASQYFGGKIENHEGATVSDMGWLFRNLTVITELDPYFEDPYYFGNALLTWNVGMYREANDLLKKGTEARTWDWMLPFFLGFNRFYYLRDPEGGAAAILEAARRPGAPDFLPTLASRLYKQAGRTETAIAFLITFAELEPDVRIKKKYEIRIEALKKMLTIEKAVKHYRHRHGTVPKTLNALVETGLLREIPKDPYGGKFYLDKDGTVKTTSKLAFLSDGERKKILQRWK